MRTLFIILRSTAYVAMLLFLFSYGREISWLDWFVSLVVVAWNSWDQLKKPNDSVFRMRLGAMIETMLILLWAVIIKDGTILFMLLSPLMRAGIHLNIKDDVLLLAVHMVVIVFLQFTVFEQRLPLLILFGSLIIIGLYSLILGLMLKQREQARRHVAITAFEREQYSKDQERIRIAGQLHDVMGQHWASIVRALDVALATQGEQSKSFVTKARETALQGLQEMRVTVHDWQDGRQTPHQWIDDLKHSAVRFREVTGIKVLLEIEPIDWNRMEHAVSTAELLVRSGMEAMTNAVRHGEASQIFLSIRQKENSIDMTVEDDGAGIDPDSGTEGSGIASIKKRVALLHGQWELDSKKGQGTKITINFPYSS
jgi:signal transduction histidine kinase